MSDNEYNYEFSADEDRHSYSSDGGGDSDFEFEEEAGNAGLRNEEDEHDQYEDGDAGSSYLAGKITLQMCPKHKPGSMVEICKVCSAALAMVRPEVAKELLAPTKVALPPPSALSRYQGRSDEKLPTMILSDSTLELAYNTFTQGGFRGKTHFPELVKKFLTLPPDQHEKLILDIKLEPFFKKLEGERRFKHIFSLRRDMGDCLKMLRISQRPIFHIISLVDGLLASVKESGQCAGIKFVEDPPCRVNSKVPKPLVNSLAIESAENIFPLPDIPSVLSGLQDLSARDEAVLKTLDMQMFTTFSNYRDLVVEQFLKLFSFVSTTVNEVDDFLAFYCDLYGHVDACTRDLLRSKLANCFKLEYRGEVLGRNLSHEQKSSLRSTGLLGGEERVRAVLSEATKKDDLLKKSVLPRKPPATDKKQKNTIGNSSSSSSRNSNRSKSPDTQKYKAGSRGADRSGRNSRGGSRPAKKDEDEGASPKRKRPRKRVSDKKGATDIRRVCFSGNTPVRQVHDMVPRQQRSSTRCFVAPVGQCHLSVSPSPAVAEGSKTSERTGNFCDFGMPSVANSTLVVNGSGDVGRSTTPTPSFHPVPEGSRQGSGTSLPGSSSGSVHFSRSFNASHSGLNLEDADLEFLSNHLASGTKSGYGYAFKAFSNFCSNFGVDPFTCPPSVLVKYIRHMYNNGAQYRTVNHHRSSISKLHVGYNGVPIGSHPLVCQAVKAVFRLRPPLPKYMTTFDISKVFDFLKKLPPNDSLSLKQLSHKALFLLTSACISRVSSVSSLGPAVKVFEDHCILDLLSLEKHSRTRRVRGFLTIKRFHEDPSLCPVEALVSYSNKIAQFNADRLCFFVSYCRPHAPVSSKTLSRWILSVLEASGLDTSTWKAHASRAAASCFMRKQLSHMELLKLADWSAASSVYRVYYERYL